MSTGPKSTKVQTEEREEKVDHDKRTSKLSGHKPKTIRGNGRYLKGRDGFKLIEGTRNRERTNVNI